MSQKHITNQKAKNKRTNTKQYIYIYQETHKTNVNNPKNNKENKILYKKHTKIFIQ